MDLTKGYKEVGSPNIFVIPIAYVKIGKRSCYYIGIVYNMLSKSITRVDQFSLREGVDVLWDIEYLNIDLNSASSDGARQITTYIFDGLRDDMEIIKYV